MPLTRATVTIASRVMLPAYPVFAAIVGFSFVTTPRERIEATASLRYADQVVPLPLWGGAFVAVAALLAVALAAHSRRLYQAVLGLMAVWMLIYSFVLIGSALYGLASWSAWAWPSFIACACWASLLSLESKEL